MKNIVEVKRLSDNRTRLYELTEGETVHVGQMVAVESRYSETPSFAVVTMDSREIDEAQEQTIRDYKHITGDFLKARTLKALLDGLYPEYDTEDADENPFETEESERATREMLEQVIDPATANDPQKGAKLDALIFGSIARERKAGFEVGFKAAVELLTGGGL